MSQCAQFSANMLLITLLMKYNTYKKYKKNLMLHTFVAFCVFLLSDWPAVVIQASAYNCN